MIQALVHGAGRMAGSVLAQMPEHSAYMLTGVVARSGAGGLGEARYYAGFELVEEPADLLIDFTLPDGALKAAQWCASRQVALLSGTTGLADKHKQALEEAARYVPVLWAPNLSPGVALVSSLVRQAAQVLGRQATISIHDRHHQHKIDAPSGTALALARAVLKGSESNETFDSDPGETKEPEITSVREGEVIGEHTVRFELPDEVIEIAHHARKRELFANGALRAGQWLVAQKPGFYTVSDWLGLE